MAVEAIAFGGTAGANQTTVFLSEYIRRDRKSVV